MEPQYGYRKDAPGELLINYYPDTRFDRRMSPEEISL